jgi:hypothetical protein
MSYNEPSPLRFFAKLGGVVAALLIATAFVSGAAACSAPDQQPAKVQENASPPISVVSSPRPLEVTWVAQLCTTFNPMFAAARTAPTPDAGASPPLERLRTVRAGLDRAIAQLSGVAAPPIREHAQVVAANLTAWTDSLRQTLDSAIDRLEFGWPGDPVPAGPAVAAAEAALATIQPREIANILGSDPTLQDALDYAPACVDYRIG